MKKQQHTKILFTREATAEQLMIMSAIIQSQNIYLTCLLQGLKYTKLELCPLVAVRDETWSRTLGAEHKVQQYKPSYEEILESKWEEVTAGIIGRFTVCKICSTMLGWS